ncbi:MAG: respiratory nitrate reductase subunit gamma [Candidatus Zixiibacteriota bacterium]|nr:MAG: respiratory nitrate reductase subunit gamma [candidate division Zixibacteria bacterium]
MNHLILGILPYFTVIIFLVGIGYRFYIWIKAPQPGAITLFPAPSGGADSFFAIVKESLLFPGLFKGDRFLWAAAWIFHVTLALIIIGHVRVFTDFPGLWAALGINADSMSAISGGIAGVTITICALLLIVRRLAILRVREISSFSDFMIMLLIMAILATGNAMRFGEHFDLNMTRSYFSALATFSLTSSLMPANQMFTLHFFLAQILIMFIPFSKILHFGGIFFTQTIIKKA